MLSRLATQVTVLVCLISTLSAPAACLAPPRANLSLLAQSCNRFHEDSQWTERVPFHGTIQEWLAQRIHNFEHAIAQNTSVQTAIDWLAERQFDPQSPDSFQSFIDAQAQGRVRAVVGFGTNCLDTPLKVAQIAQKLQEHKQGGQVICLAGGMGHNMPGNNILEAYQELMRQKGWTAGDIDNQKHTLSLPYSQRVQGLARCKRIVQNAPETLKTIRTAAADAFEKLRTDEQFSAIVQACWGVGLSLAEIEQRFTEEWIRDRVGAYVGEADIYLEIVLATLLETYRVDPKQIRIVDRHSDFNKTKIAAFLEQDLRHCVIFVDNTSTNTGQNAKYTRELLLQAGLMSQDELAAFSTQTVLVQEAFSHHRAVDTFAQEFGQTRPLSYAAYLPNYAAASLAQKTQYLLALQRELTRIWNYGTQERPFLLLPLELDASQEQFDQNLSDLVQFLLSDEAASDMAELQQGLYACEHLELEKSV